MSYKSVKHTDLFKKDLQKLIENSCNKFWPQFTLPDPPHLFLYPAPHLLPLSLFFLENKQAEQTNQNFKKWKKHNTHRHPKP